MKNNDYKYTLRPHRQGGKEICPKCGRKSFVPYIYIWSNQVLDPSCGRCDHEQSCGYHLTPAEFLRENPSVKKESFSPMSKVEPTIITFCSLAEWQGRQAREKSMESEFAQGLLNFFDTEKVAEAIRLYEVQAIGIGRQTAFPCISAEGKVTDVMVLGYKPDLHRNHICFHYYGEQQEKEKLKTTYPNGYAYSPCLFGEHLLIFDTEKNVGIVESQKTAVICSIVFPQMLWLATCGCGNFSLSKCRPLKGRRIFVYPDKGSEDKWGKIVENLQRYGYNATLRPLTEEMQDCPPNTDIADLIIENVKKNKIV